MDGPRKRLKDMSVEEMREYQRAAAARWRERNPQYKTIERERRLARIATETPEERESRRAKERAYAAANRERMTRRARERRQRDPEIARAYANAYRSKNRERVRERERVIAKRNYKKRKPSIMAQNKKRRALAKGASRGAVVLLEVLAERDRWCCHLCGGEVTRDDWSMDHLVPISMGGDHTYANVALAHRSCNSSRGAKPLGHVAPA